MCRPAGSSPRAQRCSARCCARGIRTAASVGSSWPSATALATAAVVVLTAGLGLTIVAFLAGIVGLILRARTETGVVRPQILWFAYGAAFSLAFNVAVDVAGLPALRPLGVLGLLVGIG